MAFARKILTVCAAAMVLAIGLAQPEPVTPTRPLRLLGADEEFDPVVANASDEGVFCLANQVNAPGQGLHVSGSSVGNVYVADPTVLHRDANIVTTTVSSELGGILAELLQTARWSVAILVVDDYRPFQGSTGLPSGTPPSHGDLVVHHLSTLAADLFGMPPQVDASTGELTWRITHDAELIVKPVPLLPVGVEDSASGSLIDTSLIAFKIREAVAELRSRKPISRFVVNMSWVLLPCRVLQDFKGTAFESFDDYVDALVQAQNSGDWTTVEVFQTLREGWLRDPLHEFLTDQTWQGLDIGGLGVMSVASSGNFRLSFPLLPAHWDSVVDVGSPSGPPDFSNAADVIATGAWYSVSGLAYAGTSFAAPLMSLALAVDLATGVPNCGTLRSQNGYIDDPFGPFSTPVTVAQAIDLCRQSAVGP